MKPNRMMKAAIKAGKELSFKTARSKCISCNGTGYYDNTNSPRCSECGGSGLKNIIDDLKATRN